MWKRITKGKLEKQDKSMEQSLVKNLEQNIQFFKKEFENASDIVFRRLNTNTTNACIIFVDGLIDSNRIELHALQQLIDNSTQEELSTDYLEKQIISVNSVTEVTKLEDTTKEILNGYTVLLVDQLDKAIVLEAIGGTFRSISEPDSESVIRGPREGFTEYLRVNTALIRRKLHSKNLKIVSKTVGTETDTGLAIAYLDNLAPPNLVEEVINRIEKINIDGVLESGYIEELIEDSPFSFFPQVQNTERPDAVVANLLEGRVAIFVDGTPFVLILPVTFWQFLQASEDYYQRFHISIALRILRVILIFLALLMPAFYVAVASFHQDMIPTTLLFSIAASREAIPFPVFIEALIMEFSFEALREAGIRLPKVIGQAVSILGALVIGTAAVEAGIVSAPMVIVVSLTGIASFTIPRFNMAISIRLLRFPLMVLAGMFGMFGIVLGSIVILTHLCKLRSLQ